MKTLAISILFLLSFGAFAQENDAVTLTNKGNEAVKAKDYKTAYEAYSQALVLLEQQGKVDTAMTYNTGFCALKSDMGDAAIPYFTKAIELKYKEDKAYASLAKIYSDKKDYAAMEKILTEGLTNLPTDETLKKFMSNCYLKQGLVFYNSGNEIKAAANKSGWNESDPEKFKAEYAKADAEFQNALPLMEKSYSYDATNKNTLKALQNIYTTLKMQEKLDQVNAELEKLK